MIIDKRPHKSLSNVSVYVVDKDYADAKLVHQLNKKLTRNKIKTIINHDADVFTKEGKLLLRFRKRKLTQRYIDDFYDNVIKFAKTKTNNRGSAIGSTKKNVWNNPKIMTNIIGYFDQLSPRQKHFLKQQGKTVNVSARETRFNADFPDQYKKLLPLLRQIDEYYKQYIPEKYAKQRKKANQTPFKIVGTAFTTITTNVNFQTTVHSDKGDDDEGFGNLAVIEHGKFLGGETCFPQYGIGVNVRMGDVLFMDVHQPHGNLPIVLGSPDAVRLSVVCYLRKHLWELTKGKSKEFMDSVNKTLRGIRPLPNQKSLKNKTRKSEKPRQSAKSRKTRKSRA